MFSLKFRINDSEFHRITVTKIRKPKKKFGLRQLSQTDLKLTVYDDMAAPLSQWTLES